MSNINPFPNSTAKDYIRSQIRDILCELYNGEKLNYFGLPSAEMLDVLKWKDSINKVIAVEINPDIAENIFMTATKNKIRENLIVFERSLKEVISILSKEETEIASINSLFNTEKNNFVVAKKINIGLINYDFCAGFLYVSNKKAPDNIEIFKDTIKYQIGKEFLWTITLNLRDTGFQQYKMFVEDTINKLNTSEDNRKKLKQYFVSNENNVFTKQVENLRFCLPVFLNKESKDYFNIECLGQWKYSSGSTNLYQLIMKLTPKKISALGSVFPDFTEIKKLIEVPLIEVSDDGDGIINKHTFLLE